MKSTRCHGFLLEFDSRQDELMFEMHGICYKIHFHAGGRIITFNSRPILFCRDKKRAEKRADRYQLNNFWQTNNSSGRK